MKTKSYSGKKLTKKRYVVTAVDQTGARVPLRRFEKRSKAKEAVKSLISERKKGIKGYSNPRIEEYESAF